MKLLIISHASFEKPGSITTWAKKNNHDIDEVRPYAGEAIPDVKYYDFLIVMGGPQSPLAMHKSPYLQAEIELIKKAIKLNKRIIGVCLGSQLIGEALEAKTERSPNKEIGMYPVELLYDGKVDPVFSHFPETFDVMHWHSDMPGLAVGAVLLAESEGCPRQAFRYGDRIYGFQCHFELTQELIAEMIEHCANDLPPAKYVMSMDELMRVNCDESNKKMDMVLDYLAMVPDLE